MQTGHEEQTNVLRPSEERGMPRELIMKQQSSVRKTVGDGNRLK